MRTRKVVVHIVFIVITVLILAVTGFVQASAPAKRSMLCDETMGDRNIPMASWLLTFAERGDHVAQCSLGFAYMHGYHGLLRSGTSAFAWFRKAADQGNATAQRWLGIHLRGTAEGVNWLTRAAAQGDPSAQLFLGDAYLDGKGVIRNDAEGIRWFSRAAEQGVLQAQLFLADAYRAGTHGLGQDYAKAYFWRGIAARFDPFILHSQVNEYKIGLASRQVSEADRAASAWMPRYEPVKHLNLLGACCLGLWPSR